jgi:tetratricopeptide (TPR) repeat protein
MLREPDLSTEILRHAERLCRGEANAGTKSEPLRLYAALAERNREPEFALACVKRAVVLAPENVECVAEAAVATGRLGELREAVSLSLREVHLAPRDAGAYARCARNLARSGAMDAAIVAQREAIRLEPRQAGLYQQLGQFRLSAGYQAEALAAFYHALMLDPESHESRCGLGETYLAIRDWTAALTSFQTGLHLRPDDGALLFGRAKALAALGRAEDAAQAFRMTLAIEPRHVEACHELATLLDLLGKPGDAASAWCCLGSALANNGRFSDAAEAYRQALERDPRYLRALVLLASTQREMGDASSAVAHFERAIALAPEYGPAHVGLAWNTHLVGDAARGWREFAWHRAPGEVREFEQPAWDGDPLATGKTILLWADQALGDTLQSLRYVPFVKGPGVTVIVECSNILTPLAEGMAAVDRVVARRTPLPSFDVHAPLGALPFLLLPHMSWTPCYVPYLTVKPCERKQWRERIGTRRELTVGVVWAGESTRTGGRIKFAPFEAFSPLAEICNVRFVSLQMRPQSAELLVRPVGLSVERLLSDPCPIEHTAALIAALDLVLTVDTMVAHLAGGLAKPVWLLLPSTPDWRWLAAGDTSAWYPTMRLFRQARPGDWGAVVRSVTSQLERLLA